MKQLIFLLLILSALFSYCSKTAKLAPESIGIEMVLIHGGEFMMGDDDSLVGSNDEVPVHRVVVTDFLMGATEVTQGQYIKIMGDSSFYNTGDMSLPADRVSWINAARFCNALSDSAGYQQCYDTETWECDFSADGFRMPTEAEWEYAARAGTTTRFFTGDSAGTLDDYAWIRKNSGGKVHPVGTKKPNPFGLYDMHGNVFEWCNDWFEIEYYADSPVQDPRGPETGEFRVKRDAAAIFAPEDMRSANRGRDYPDRDIKFIGFRLARNAPAEPSSQ